MIKRFQNSPPRLRERPGTIDRRDCRLAGSTASRARTHHAITRTEQPGRTLPPGPRAVVRVGPTPARFWWSRCERTTWPYEHDRRQAAVGTRADHGTHDSLCHELRSSDLTIAPRTEITFEYRRSRSSFLLATERAQQMARLVKKGTFRLSHTGVNFGRDLRCGAGAGGLNRSASATRSVFSPTPSHADTGTSPDIPRLRVIPSRSLRSARELCAHRATGPSSPEFRPPRPSPVTP